MIGRAKPENRNCNRRCLLGPSEFWLFSSRPPHLSYHVIRLHKRLQYSVSFLLLTQYFEMARSKLTKCRSCGQQVSEEAKACPKCGETNFRSAVCFFCGERFDRKDAIGKTVREWDRGVIFVRKTRSSISKVKKYFHSPCIEERLGPNKKTVRMNCSDCNSALRVNANRLFERGDIGRDCPQCGSPDQPRKRRRKPCDICRCPLFPQFQSISSHKRLNTTYKYHKICAIKEGVGLYDLGSGRTLLMLGACIFVLVLIFASLF